MRVRDLHRHLGTALTVLFFAGLPAQALGPHECALLVNARSRESVEIANHYAHLRRIPPNNIIHLDLPDKALEAEASFTPDEFREHIYEPAMKILRDRGIAGHILAWLYSAGFPAMVETRPPMSLTGMTFVRGNPPEREAIASGKWLSPLFIGPDQPGGPMSAPTSLENFTIQLTTNMPIPSMMIAWTGSRGMTTEQVKEHLRRSAAADGSHPSATVYFEQTDDVRSQTRSWQFEGAARELATLGVAAITVSNAPSDRPDIMGILAGRQKVNKGDYGPLMPGAYADHLTSFAAVFEDHNQSKLTEWLRLGAAGGSGTVTEPGSLKEPVVLWAKFPHARLFTHYASGCTLLESLYQAIRSPLQILLVGDALASPWARPPGITLVNMADDENAPLRGRGDFLASSWGGFGQQPPTTIFFLDGRPVNQPGNKNTLEIDTTRLPDGAHDLRAVAYASDRIRHQGFDTTTFRVRNRTRGVELSGYTPGQDVDMYHELGFTITADGSPRDAAIVAQERVIARAAYSNGMILAVPPLAVGAGPVSFQGVVVYDDNQAVRSEPMLLNVAPLNRAPVIDAIAVLTNNDTSTVLTMVVSDAEGDTVSRLWCADVLLDDQRPAATPADAEGLVYAPGSGELRLSGMADGILATFNAHAPGRIRELRTRLRFTEGYDVSWRHQAGIVFNATDEDNYLYWGIDGKRSAWTLIRVQDGKETTLLSRGARIEPRTDYDVMILSLPGARMGFFVNSDLVAVTDASFGAGRIGVYGGDAAVTFHRLLVSPPSAYHAAFSERVDDLVITAEADHLRRIVHGAARDVQFTTLRLAP